MSQMRTVELRCRFHREDDGYWTLLIEIGGLTRFECAEIGMMTHDPIQEAVTNATTRGGRIRHRIETIVSPPKPDE